MLLGATSCSDDHFDIKSDTATSANTIWQNIESREELQSLAKVLSRALASTSETQIGDKQTYAEFLNQPQQLTAWLPVLTEDQADSLIAILDSADAIRATDPAAARIIDYEVSKKFVRNHIARFNYESLTTADEVRLLNSKLAIYDPANSTFNGVPLVGNKIVSSNGMLHLLSGISPFKNNILDYLESEPTTSDLYAEIDARNVYTFSSSSSTAGTMNSNGEMEYVDSVYTLSNDLLYSSYVGAYSIQNEDSLYITVVPSNTAYAQARNVVKDLFKYKNTYNYDWTKYTTANGGYWNSTGTSALSLNTDSLQELMTTRAILGSMMVSASYFTDVINKNDRSVLTKAQLADSLITTGDYILYNKTPGEKNPIFSDVEPVEASNGYIYKVDEYNYDPAYTMMTERIIIPRSGNIAQTSGTATINSGKTVTLTSENRNDSVSGNVPDDTYYYFAVSNNAELQIDIRLNNVYSGKYKVTLMMVPNRMDINNMQTDDAGDEVVESPQFLAQIYDDQNNNLTARRTVRNEVDQNAVSKIVLWDEVEFPYCYVGLPDGVTSFPILRLTMNRQLQNRGNCKALSIAAVILEPIREDAN